MTTAQSPWKFILVCDSRGHDGSIQKTFLNEIVSETVCLKVDFVIFPSDIISGHTVIDSVEFEVRLMKRIDVMEQVNDAYIGVYVGRGNHKTADTLDFFAPEQIDLNDNYLTRWLNVFGSDFDPLRKLPANGPEGEQYMTYSVEHKNASITTLDQYDGIGHEVVQRIYQHWLDTQLTANPAVLYFPAQFSILLVTHRDVSHY